MMPSVMPVRPSSGSGKPALDQAGAVLEELAIGEDARGAGVEGALARELVVVLRHRDDRQPRARDAFDGGHAVEALRGEVDDGPVDGLLVLERRGFERDGELLC